MLIYLREALILVSGWGFFRGFGGSVFVRVGVFFFFFFIVFFWQNHYNAGVLWEWDGLTAESESILQQYSVFPLLVSRTSQKYPFFPSKFCRAQLFSEPSAPLPNHIMVRSSQHVGVRGGFFTRHRSRDRHPGFEQPIFVLEVYRSAVLPM